jgi:RNA polymerase sigma factor (sigma-70 family)
MHLHRAIATHPMTDAVTDAMTEDTRSRTKRLADAALMAKIREKVPRKLQPADADEIVQKVFLRLLLIATLPPTQDRLLGLAVIVTKQVSLDHFRRASVRLGREADVEEHSELLPAPELQVDLDEEQKIRLALDKVEEDAAAGRIPKSLVRIAQLLAEGKTYAEIAELTGSTEAAVKMQASRLRSHLRQHWAKWLAAATGVGALVLYLVIGRRPAPSWDIGPDTAAMSASAAPSTAPAGSTSRGPSFMDQATLMCADGFYDECEKDLDQAVARNPQFEALPEVKAMRAAIAKWKAQEGAPKPGKFPKAPQ